MIVEKEDIEIFWNWFHSVSSKLYINSKDADILKLLDQKVTELGPFEWEIGPIDETLLYLAISPNLDSELLKATTELVKQAPVCKRWIFFAAKPFKPYSPILNLTNEYGRAISIDISNWTYVLFSFEDGTFDIDVKIDPINGNKETQNLALDIIMANILGEEKYMTLFKNVNIVNHFGDDENKATPIKHLNEHIVKVLN